MPTDDLRGSGDTQGEKPGKRSEQEIGNDFAIVEQCFQQDPRDGLIELTRRLCRWLAYLISQLSTHFTKDEVEDLIQDVLLVLARRVLHCERGVRDAPMSWIHFTMGVVKNVTLRALRKKKVRGKYVSQRAEEFGAAQSQWVQDEIRCRNGVERTPEEVNAIIEFVTLQFVDRGREVVRLFLSPVRENSDDAWSERRIARHLKMGRGTVRRHMDRARSILEGLLNESVSCSQGARNSTRHARTQVGEV